MFHDRTLRSRAADPRPGSAVSHGAGMAGLAGVGAWIAAAKLYHLDGPYSALVNLAACALPMVLWSLLVDKVHLSPSTGIDWANPKPRRETLDVSLTKLAGLWATWGAIALIYATGRFYWQGGFVFAMWCFTRAAPMLFVLSIPYVLWIDRRLVEPKDGAHQLGAWMMGQPYDAPAIHAHLRAWGVKAFFLAFMLAIVPPGFGELIRTGWRDALESPVALASLLVTGMFTIDVAFASVGYVLTMRPLDSHIRSTNPHAAAWTAALMCYPPFILMTAGGPLDYHSGTMGDRSWAYWFDGHAYLLSLWGAALVSLTAVYACATVAFGMRFSNLTHRGVLTHGPYGWSRHPAYLSKNLFWWLSTLPFLSTAGLVEGTRATLLLGAVSGVYYWRARTEERHLRADPAYREYDAWMARNAPVPRFFAWVRGG